MNHKKFREERLQVRRRKGRKRALGTRRSLEVPQGITSAGASTLCLMRYLAGVDQCDYRANGI